MANNLSGHILIINPDIIISRNTICEMGKVLTDEVGIVSVRTVNTDGKILFDAIKLKGLLQKNIMSNKETIETDYSQGSCMLINRKVVNEIGLFDERFFIYWEEVDFSLRTRKLKAKLISITTSHIIKSNNSLSRAADSLLLFS